MVTYLNREIIIKDYKNRTIVNRIKNKLILDFEEHVGFRPMIKQFGDFQMGKYTIYFICKGFELNIDFMYESQEDVLTNDDMNSPLSDKELSLELDIRREMNYIIIHSFGVTPTGKGLGALLMTKLFEIIECENKFKLICLLATNDNAIRFWKMMGFVPIAIVPFLDIKSNLWSYNLFKYLNFNEQQIQNNSNSHLIKDNS